MKIKTMVFVGMLCFLLVMGGTALAFEAPKVDAPLVFGEDWPVDDDNAYNAFEDEAGWKLWVFWDDDNVYLQYDVFTDFPMANNYDEHSIWNADSVEWQVRAGTVLEKWIVGLTANGYQIVTRQPRTIIEPGEGVDVLIEPTDFGYRGQIIFDRSHPHMAKFEVASGFEAQMSVQVNDSIDGDERTRILGGFVDSGQYVDLVFVD